MIKRLNVIMIIFFLFGRSYAGDLKAEQKYKIIKPVYLIGEYIDRGNKTLSRATAKAFLESGTIAKKSYTAYQTEVPTGTVMTIIGPAPKRWYLYFQGDRYFIRLDPDLSRGLEITIQLGRGMEGNLDGLNQELFSRI